MIHIVDYKTGNLGSIQNMLKKVGEQSVITSKPEELERATKIILPGVGAFDKGVSMLREFRLWNVLNDKVLSEKVPVLGICLGAQLMTIGSEEGKLDGFGWVEARTCKFQVYDKVKFKIPHMGWNRIKVLKPSKLVEGINDNPKFYFVHSYYMKFSDLEQVLFECNYNSIFHAGFEKDNIMGVQFHPEKSHKYGMKLLENFVDKY